MGFISFNPAYAADIVTGSIAESLSEIMTASVNGAPLNLDLSGNFSQAVDYNFGINLVETLATDSNKNLKADRRAVVAGSFVPENDGIDNGIIARINEDTINTIEGLGEDLIADADLAAFIPNPVFSDSEETCIPFIGCFTWYSLVLRIYNPSMDSVDIELNPMANGTIYTTVVAYNIYIDWNANGVVAEIPYSASGTVTADSVTISMDITPSISNGTIHTAVSNVSVSSSGFDFDFNSWIYDAAEFFGINVDGIVRGYMEDAVENVVRDEVPPLLEEKLQDLELSTSLAFQGNNYTLMAEPDYLSVDDVGMTLSLKTYLSPDQWLSPYTGLGSLYSGYSIPYYSGTSGMVVSISADFINQALFEFWGGGLLMQEFLPSDLGVDLEDLDFLPGNLADLHIDIDAMLPPVVLPGTGSNLLDIQLGDLMVAIYSNDSSDPNDLLVRMYVGLKAGLDINVTPNATLSASIYDLDTWFDVDYVSSGLPIQMEAFLETFLDQIMPSLMPLITDAIGEIPIPEFSGYSLSNITIEAAGLENGYVNASGNITGP